MLVGDLCHDGGAVLDLPRGDLYYVLVVPAGVSLLLPFSGLTLELFIFPDSDDLDSLPVRQAWSRIFFLILVR